MKHRHITLFLAATWTLTAMASISAYAEEASDTDESSIIETFESGDFTYTLTEEETAEILAYSGSDTALTLPSELDGYPVTAIGDDAFDYHTEIVSLTIPASLETWGDSCFYGCTSLETITVENGSDFFAVSDGALISADGVYLYLYPTGLKADSYTIPDGVQEIFASAFAQTTLSEVIFPDSLLYIDNWTFCYSSIDTLTLPDSLLEIGEYAFAYCTELTEVVFPDSLELIDSAAFAFAENLTSITLNSGLTEIYQHAFTSTGLTEVTIPASVTTIGYCAFGYTYDADSGELTADNSFVVYGVSGSQAETYCTDVDSDNDYENNFTFCTVKTDESSAETVQVATDTSGFSNYINWIREHNGKWILLGIGCLVLVIGGLWLILGGRKKQSGKNAADGAKTDDGKNI